MLAYLAGFAAGRTFRPPARWREVVDASFELVREKYVEEVPPDELTFHTLEGLYGALDDYSRFFTPEEYQEFQEEVSGNYGGVGLIISEGEEGISVVTPITGGPAFEAGMLPGDVIVEIDGEPVDGEDVEGACQRMRGRPGTTVALKFLRPPSASPEEVTLTRRIIHVPSVLSARMLRNGKARVGYVMLADFQEDAATRLTQAVERLKKEGMEALVLDLRGNGGGAYESALKVADLFLEEGLIVRVCYRQGRDVLEEATPRSLGDFPLAVLVNRGSASASEIVAAALKENGRAVLVGEPTYGKGSVQELFDLELPDGRAAAAKLTVAYFYSPSGRAISRRRNGTGRGLAPDYTVEMDPETRKRYSRALHNEWILANTGRAPGPWLEEVDPQLGKAIELLLSRLGRSREGPAE